MLTIGDAGRQPAVIVLDDEYVKLADLVCSSARPTPGISLLWQELQRAIVTPAERAPEAVVRMGSRVDFTDLARRESRQVRLVYPAQASAPVLLPVTSSLGAALLGLRSGATFCWTGADRRPRGVRVEAVGPPLPLQITPAHAR